MTRQFDIRNPPLKFRKLMVALVLSSCGALGGLIIAVFLGATVACIFLGAVVGALLGATVEGYKQ